jgi:hypothetical protein
MPVPKMGMAPICSLGSNKNFQSVGRPDIFRFLQLVDSGFD